MPIPDGHLPATERQVAYLTRLASEQAVFGAEKSVEDTQAEMAKIIGSLTKQEASALIEQAIRSPRFPDTARPLPPWRVNALRELAPKYAIFGLGVDRDETVAKVEALIEAGLNADEGANLIRTAYNSPPHPSPTSALPLRVVSGIDGLRVAEGNYAVASGDFLRFYTIYVPFKGEHQGQPLIKRYLTSETTPITPDEVRGALRLIDADPAAAAYRFADDLGRCFMCARPLTDPVSRFLSVGPQCRGFAAHRGLKDAAARVDQEPRIKKVFRALQEWALDQGFTDPRTKEQRAAQRIATASQVASAWSGLPGVTDLPADEAVPLLKAAIEGDLDPRVKEALLAAPADTVAVLIESRVLSGNLFLLLAEHPSKRIRDAAAEAFLDVL